jgi:phosphatidylglycerophosphatase A
MSRLVASLLGLGHLRPAPGTWGSLAAVILGFLLARFGGAWVFLAATVLAIPLAYWSIADLISRLGEPGPHDPSWVVIDELAGQWIALLPVVFGALIFDVPVQNLWPGWVSAFLLFRLFDIWKPSLVGWADRQHGPTGVVLDDLIAGLFAGLGVLVLAGLGHGIGALLQ